jgi:quinol monooxygenase YgiN
MIAAFIVMHQGGSAMHTATFCAAAGILLAGAVIAHAQAPAPAQPAPLPDVSPQFVVSYIEVAPGASDAAAKAARDYRNAARRESGVVQFEIFQRIHARHHFAIVAQWKDTKDFLAHGDAAHTKAFRRALGEDLIAPYDERRHHALNIGNVVPARTGLVAVTHVDIIPPARDEGIAAVKTLADKSRGTPGNLRYDALTQSNRPNHMTLVEVWQDDEAYRTHLLTAHMKAFRDTLLPRSGSLYDERLYQALD